MRMRVASSGAMCAASGSQPCPMPALLNRYPPAWHAAASTARNTPLPQRAGMTYTPRAGRSSTTQATPAMVTTIPSHDRPLNVSPSVSQANRAAKMGAVVESSAVRRGPIRTYAVNSAQSPRLKPTSPDRASSTSWW